MRDTIEVNDCVQDDKCLSRSLQDTPAYPTLEIGIWERCLTASTAKNGTFFDFRAPDDMEDFLALQLTFGQGQSQRMGESRCVPPLVQCGAPTWNNR